jgi:hypothetical protein
MQGAVLVRVGVVAAQDRVGQRPLLAPRCRAEDGDIVRVQPDEEEARVRGECLVGRGALGVEGSLPVASVGVVVELVIACFVCRGDVKESVYL